ncbi:hypothetical protein CRENBAI_016256 [Crenichthys baileyi]|uniref:Uncharacterized protein n=1 Tax=Crenichthys baileyi TaxID=28760 RepID=A0AAV9S4S4_9TELE
MAHIRAPSLGHREPPTHRQGHTPQESSTPKTQMKTHVYSLSSVHSPSLTKCPRPSTNLCLPQHRRKMYSIAPPTRLRPQHGARPVGQEVAAEEDHHIAPKIGPTPPTLHQKLGGALHTNCTYTCIACPCSTEQPFQPLHQSETMPQIANTHCPGKPPHLNPAAILSWWTGHQNQEPRSKKSGLSQENRNDTNRPLRPESKPQPRP